MLPIGDHSLERIAICLEELLRQTFPRSREIDWILHGSPFQANGNRMHCLLPKHALICHIMISSKLLCRISIHDSVSWVPSACPCAVSSPPTYIALLSTRTRVLPFPSKDWGAPACSVHWPDSWPCPLWRKCVHLPVPWRILLWVIPPRRAPCPQPTQPPINTWAFSPQVVENRDLDSGKRRPGQDSESAGPGPVPQEEWYTRDLISPRARTELNKYASDHLITNTLHISKCFLATHLESLKTLKQPHRLHWTLVNMLLCWVMP